jgi:hypothetical protein
LEQVGAVLAELQFVLALLVFVLMESSVVAKWFVLAFLLAVQQAFVVVGKLCLHMLHHTFRLFCFGLQLEKYFVW